MPLSSTHRILLLALALTLVGCPKEADQATGNSVELWTMQLKPTFETYMTGLIAAWEKTHPGVKVTWVDLPSSEIENKTLTAAASGHAPDLVNLNPAFANKLANAKALKTLPVDAAYKDQFFEAAWQANTVDGQIVGLPWYLSTSVTLFNRDLWKQAGLTDQPHSWKDLGEAARTIKAKTKARGFMPNFGDRGKFMEILASEGIGLLSTDGKHASFNTPAGADVVKFWADLIHDGVIPQECLTQGHREAIDRFQAGQTAVFPAGPQFLTTIKQNSPQLYAKIDVGRQITGGSGKLGVGVMNLVIPVASTHQDLALDLGKFIVSGPNQLAFCKIVPILPSEKSAAADTFFKPLGGGLEEKARAIAAEQLQHATLLVPPLPHQNELAKALDDALQRAALGKQTPAEALKQAAEDWDRVLATP
ncbi:MAG: putative chitobiose transport system substrate-binding protein [Cyanobacteria bacterium RYN_339]|nr:putative chitobiose transport system substrate-binding protein [Cyanobacteria bacterium RYN_339]